MKLKEINLRSKKDRSLPLRHSVCTVLYCIIYSKPSPYVAYRTLHDHSVNRFSRVGDFTLLSYQEIGKVILDSG